MQSHELRPLLGRRGIFGEFHAVVRSGRHYFADFSSVQPEEYADLGGMIDSYNGQVIHQCLSHGTADNFQRAQNPQKIGKMKQKRLSARRE